LANFLHQKTPEPDTLILTRDTKTPALGQRGPVSAEIVRISGLETGAGPVPAINQETKRPAGRKKKQRVEETKKPLAAMLCANSTDPHLERHTSGRNCRSRIKLSCFGMSGEIQILFAKRELYVTFMQ